LGVPNYLSGKLPLAEGSTDLGPSFEHFIINEVRAYLSYHRKNSSISYWRSRKTEVDLLVGKKLAIEIKFSKTFKPEFTDGLGALREESLIEKYMVIGRFQNSGVYEGIEYLPYQEFLKRLWSHQYRLL
jgi:predicted AAA+ superfamily ATPase